MLRRSAELRHDCLDLSDFSKREMKKDYARNLMAVSGLLGISFYIGIVFSSTGSRASYESSHQTWTYGLLHPSLRAATFGH